MELVGGWGLTERNIGSDASNMESTVKYDKEKDVYVLNGTKRWIGNASKHLITVFARNVDNN
jgi:alkylation response protein AidB-like acyl-CoA dehydrogenase